MNSRALREESQARISQRINLQTRNKQCILRINEQLVTKLRFAGQIFGTEGDISFVLCGSWPIKYVDLSGLTTIFESYETWT